MNDVALHVAPGEARRRGLKKPRVWRVRAVLMFAITLAMVALSLAPALAASTVIAPRLASTPINRTTTSISVRFYRSPDPDLVCKADIGYEVRGGVFADWHQVGGFPNAPCDDPDPGYKFTGLTPATTYVLSIRAYRLVAGVKDSYSTESSITASTLAEIPSPTPTPTPTPTMSPTPSPTASGSSTVSAPRLASTPSNRTTTSISVRFYRSPDPDLVCKADIGYEVRGGVFADWHDVGGFPNAPCDNPDPGYKFTGLTPETTYVLSIRAYRLVAGVKDSYSTESSITASTLAEIPSPTPTPTTSPTPIPTSSPTDSPTDSPSSPTASPTDSPSSPTATAAPSPQG
jgi:hypothetical protein